MKRFAYCVNVIKLLPWESGGKGGYGACRTKRSAGIRLPANVMGGADLTGRVDASRGLRRT
jgi:hypothetical protein